jgi:hypothetical protein
MQTVAWLAGRGVAQSCGLDWEVPEVLYEALHAGKLRRTEFEARIREALAAAQAVGLTDGSIDPMPLERLLDCLDRRTSHGWRHVFLTTNWNTLLDRVLARRGGRVWHLNGSVETTGHLDTEIDNRDAAYRVEGFDYLARAQVCVLAGLSFASRLDRALLERLGGKAYRACIVVNEEAADAARAAGLLHDKSPCARITQVHATFENWVRGGLRELRPLGVLT